MSKRRYHQTKIRMQNRPEIKREHKTVMHLCIVGLISLMLAHEGAQLADWGFVFLAAVVEIW